MLKQTFKAGLAEGKWDGKGSDRLPGFGASQNTPNEEMTVHSAVIGKQNTVTQIKHRQLLTFTD